MSHVHPREAARSVHSGSGAQYLPVPVRLEVHYCDFAASCRAVASSDNKAPARANCESGNRRAGSHYPTHADSMSKFLSSRSARLFLCFRKQLNIN
jgi:hypothetical protein